MEPIEFAPRPQKLSSSKLLIKQILESDGLRPEEIEAVLRAMPQDFHEDPIDDSNNNVEHPQEVQENHKEPVIKEENKLDNLIDSEDLPEDLKQAIAGLSLNEQQEIVKQYREEQETTKYIITLMEKEQEEKSKAEKASQEYILKYLNQEEEKKENENDEYIDELMAKELQEKEQMEQQEDRASEDYIRKLLQEEEKEEVEDNQPAPTCAICLDDLFSQAVFPLYNCGHLYHIECLESYVIEEIKKRAFPIRCPHPDCKKEIPEDDIKDTLQGHIQYQDIYDEYYIKSYVESNPNDFLHCPTPNCKFVCCMVDGPRFDCPECKKNHCMKCETEWHFNLTCEAYQQQKRST